MKIAKGLKIAIPVIALIAGSAPFTLWADDMDLPEEAPDAVVQEQSEAVYTKFKGMVSEVRGEGSSATFVRVEEGDQTYDFRVGEHTIFVTTEGVKPVSEIKEGDELTVYYIPPLANILIFPPQMEASVFAEEPTNAALSIFVGHFDENLVSDNNYMKINEDMEKTKVYNSKGDETTEDIRGKDLAVVFGAMTRSLPGQTTPEIIVILDGQEKEGNLGSIDMPSESNAIAEPLELSDEDKANLAAGIASGLEEGNIIVQNENIDAPKPFALDSHVMLPVRAIAEAAGFEVAWESESQVITVGFHITLTVDQDYYTFAKMEPITLGQAPVNKDGVVYAPLEFFDRVMNLEVSVVNSDIVINERPQIHD